VGSSSRRWRVSSIQPLRIGPIASANQLAVKTTDSVHWLEAVVQEAQGSATHRAAVVLRLPGGTQMELADVTQVPLVAALVQALAKPC
jgi:hypothetical protein